jgi:biotin carboxylase
MKKIGIMILGAGVMQLPAYEAAQKNNWKVIAADGNAQAPCRNKADLFLHIDLKDRIGLADAVQELKDEMNLQGVFTCGTDFSNSVAWIAEKLNLPGISYKTALDCTDKYRMRQRFQENNIPSPGFCELSADMDFIKEVSKLEYPLVVKPVDNMGGRGVITVPEEEYLEKAVKEAISFSRTGRAIAEEFMDGDEYSIDSLILSEDEIIITGFADRHIYYPPCFIEMGHTLPSKLGVNETENMFSVFKDAVKALGITSGAAKGDVKLTSRGVMIGEIAARLSGGYMSGWTYPYASGVDLVEEGMKIALGMIPEKIEEKISKTSSERAYISIPGVIENLKGIEEAHEADEIKDIFILAEEGERVHFPLNNVMKCGNVIAVADDREDALAASEKAVSSIRIGLKAGDAETQAFLEQDLNTSFPPSAYDLESWDSLEYLKDFKADFSMQYKDSSIIIPSEKSIEFLSQKDWNAVSLKRVLNEISEKTDLIFDEQASWNLFSGHFWYALLRGGIQGALWYINNNDKES